MRRPECFLAGVAADLNSAPIVQLLVARGIPLHSQPSEVILSIFCGRDCHATSGTNYRDTSKNRRMWSCFNCDFSSLSLLNRDLSYNQLTGSIPCVDELTNLMDLWVVIPFAAQLDWFTVSDLSFNSLTGTIPNLNTLTNLNALWVVVLTRSLLTFTADFFLTINSLDLFLVLMSWPIWWTCELVLDSLPNLTLFDLLPVTSHSILSLEPYPTSTPWQIYMLFKSIFNSNSTNSLKIALNN